MPISMLQASLCTAWISLHCVSERSFSVEPFLYRCYASSSLVKFIVLCTVNNGSCDVSMVGVAYWPPVPVLISKITMSVRPENVPQRRLGRL